MATTPIPARPPGEPPSAIQTARPFVAFKPDNVPPSQFVYLQQNDYIFLRTLSNTSNVTFNWNYRYLTPQGEIKEGSLPITAGIVEQAFTITIGEAWLLSFAVTWVGPAVNGQFVHITAIIERGASGGALFFPDGVLWEGYLISNAIEGWPGASVKHFWDGAGAVRSITGTQPAVGTEISEVVPTRRRWTLLAFRALLNSSATVANRFGGYLVDDGTNILVDAHSTTAQTASINASYIITPSSPFFADGQNNFLLPAPSIVALKAGFHIKTSTVGLQATDQWSAPQYLVLEWVTLDS